MYLNNQELAQIVGGGLTATLLNAVSRLVKTIYDIGYAIGSTIRRTSKKKYC